MNDEEKRRRLVMWVTQRVLPHEMRVRAWLARSQVTEVEIDDLIQEAYCRLSALEDVSHIDNPGGFFFQTVRNIHLNRIKHARIVRIESLTELELNETMDETPSPERIAGDRREWDRVQAIVDSLPPRCRDVMRMRKIEDLPQKEIARRLGITENVVENEASGGIRFILEALRAQSRTIASEYEMRRPRRRREP